MSHLINKKLLCLAAVCAGCGILARFGLHWYEAKVIHTLNSEPYNKAKCDAETIIKRIRQSALQACNFAGKKRKSEQSEENVFDDVIMSIYVNSIHANEKSVRVVNISMSIFEANGWTLNELFELYCVLRHQYFESNKENVNNEVPMSHMEECGEETNYLYLLTCNMWNCLSALLEVQLFLYVFEDTLCDDCKRTALMETINTNRESESGCEKCAIVYLPSIELQHIMSRDDVITLLSIAKVLVQMYPCPIESNRNGSVHVHEFDKELIQKACGKEKHDSSRWYTMWLFTHNVLELCGWRTLLKVCFLLCTQRELLARLAPDYDVECVDLCSAELVNAQANCGVGVNGNAIQQSFASFVHENVTHKAGRLIAVSILLRVLCNIAWSSRVTLTSIVLTPYYNNLTFSTLLNLSRQDYVPSERWQLPLRTLSALQYLIEFCADDVSFYLSEIVINLDYLQTWSTYFIATTATWLVQNTYSYIEDCWIRARVASDYVKCHKRNDATITEKMENVKVQSNEPRKSFSDNEHASENTEEKLLIGLLDNESEYHYGLAVLLYSSLEHYQQKKYHSVHNHNDQVPEAKVLFLDSSHLPQLVIRLPTEPVSALKLTYLVCNAILASECAESNDISNEPKVKKERREKIKHNIYSNSEYVKSKCLYENSILCEHNEWTSANEMNGNNCTCTSKRVTSCNSELTSITLYLQSILCERLQSSTLVDACDNSKKEQRAMTTKYKRQEGNDNDLWELRLNGCESNFYKSKRFSKVNYSSYGDWDDDDDDNDDVYAYNDDDMEHVINEANTGSLLTQIMSAIFRCFNIVPIIATVAFHNPSREHDVETNPFHVKWNSTQMDKREMESVAPQIARIFYSASAFDLYENNVPITWWDPISPFLYCVEAEKSKYAFCNSYVNNWKIVDKLCHCKPHIDRLLSHETIPLPLHGAWKITFDHVSFRYSSRKRNVLTDISFTVESSCSLGIIGFSGSGKTTILLLITRFYLPLSGAIYINDIPIERFSVRELRRRIGHAWQSTNEMRFFENSTIEANIALANVNTHESHEDSEQFEEHVQEQNKLWMENQSSVEESYLCRHVIRNIVNTALAKAQAFDFVNARACGVSNMLDCSEYSGGELERINIARCFAQNEECKGLYLLDECTNALDSITEKKIISSIQHSQSTCQNTLEQKDELANKLKRSTTEENRSNSQFQSKIQESEFVRCKRRKKTVTVIFTSHRLATIRNCDEIIVLNKGRIVERGSWESLSTDTGNTYFNKLLKLQSLKQKCKREIGVEESVNEQSV